MDDDAVLQSLVLDLYQSIETSRRRTFLGCHFGDKHLAVTCTVCVDDSMIITTSSIRFGFRSQSVVNRREQLGQRKYRSSSNERMPLPAERAMLRGPRAT